MAHEERSTSYHRETTEGLAGAARVIGAAGRRVPDWLEPTSSRAVRWQAALAGPDSRLPLLNDAWEGPPTDGPADGEPVTIFVETGYAVVRSGGDQLVFDAGPICPAHLPPHAHADVLSFVLWVDGRPIVVDPGSYTYTGPRGMPSGRLEPTTRSRSTGPTSASSGVTSERPATRRRCLRPPAAMGRS